jgi:hypothetical protein
MVLVAEKFSVPAVGIVDTDALLDDGNEERNQGRTSVFVRWARMGITPQDIKLNDLGSLRSLRSGSLRVLQPDNDEDVDWRMDIEKLFQQQMLAIPIEEGRGAPSAFGEIAEKWCPPQYVSFLHSLFSDLELLAGGPQLGQR